MKFRRTKIIATLGPETSTPRMIERLVQAGANVFRLNFSHGTIKGHLETVRKVRAVSKKLHAELPVLADLPGPKLRTGYHRDGQPIRLNAGETCILTTRPVLGEARLIPVVFKALPKYLNRGDRVLLSDGLLELVVLKKNTTDIQCKVLSGGDLGEHKGINLPGLKLRIPAITERDREIIRQLIRHDIDYIALSFVQREQDVELARTLIRKKTSIPIIAKIEKPQALDHIEAILKIADGVMIARGDLGVEIPAAKVPVIQKELIHLAALRGVPIITATQMLDSMVQNPRPTRAETTDVANAIWDGSDVVMLSNETAAGRYPVQAVETMTSIIEQAESHPDFQWVSPNTDESNSAAESILLAATRVAHPKTHKAIVTYTKSGSTAISLSKLRPKVPIYALTPSEETYRRLGLIWGVRAYVSPHGKNVNEMIRIGDQVLMRKTNLKKKDSVVMVAGTQLSSGATNILKIHQIGEALTGRRATS